MVYPLNRVIEQEISGMIAFQAILSSLNNVTQTIQTVTAPDHREWEKKTTDAIERAELYERGVIIA